MESEPDENGLTQQEYQQGWHMYGNYKIYHKCLSCGQKREIIAYDRGWIDSEKCYECMKKN